jgi:hypothetical protein
MMIMMMMIKIQSKADAVKQVGRSVEQHASEFQYLWVELDHYASLKMKSLNDARDVSKCVDDRRATHFLKILTPNLRMGGPSFVTRRVFLP